MTIMFSTKNKMAIDYTTYEGATAAAIGSLISTFLTAFCLYLGYDRVIIGILIALQLLVWAIMQIPAAFITQLTGYRKRISIISSFVARFSWVFVGLVPYLFNSSMAMIILFAMIANAGAAFLGPAWASWIGDIVHSGERGKYFSRRNKYSVVFAIIAVITTGIMLEISPETGFNYMFAVAGIAGVLSAIFFAFTPNYRSIGVATNPVKEIKSVMSNRFFKHFCMAFFLWQFGFIAWDTFSEVYIIQNLSGSYIWLAIAFVSGSVASVIMQKFWGRVSDKYTHRSVMIFACIGTVAAPMLWFFFVDSLWLIIPIEFFSGMMLAGFNMASFNYLLEISPYDRRQYYTAIFWAIIGIAGFFGTITSGFISTLWIGLIGVGGLKLSLLMSFIARAAGFVLFIRFVKELPNNQSWVKYIAGDFARVTGSFIKSPLLPIKKFAVSKSRLEKKAKPPERKKYKFKSG